jgi:NAD(P)-dependent dehydrogenase (short-subunit alcohol dehydrogenase family)
VEKPKRSAPNTRTIRPPDERRDRQGEEAEIAEIMETTLEPFGRLDIVVNSGGSSTSRFCKNSPWRNRINAINLSSAFHTTRLALPGMVMNKWGRIINVASAHGLVGSPSDYVADKHGILGLTKVTALETAEQGIPAMRSVPVMSIRRWLRRKSRAKRRRTEFCVITSSATCCWRSNRTNALPPLKRSGPLQFFSTAIRRPPSPASRCPSTKAGPRTERAGA